MGLNPGFAMDLLRIIEAKRQARTDRLDREGVQRELGLTSGAPAAAAPSPAGVPHAPSGPPMQLGLQTPEFQAAAPIAPVMPQPPIFKRATDHIPGAPPEINNNPAARQEAEAARARNLESFADAALAKAHEYDSFVSGAGQVPSTALLKYGERGAAAFDRLARMQQAAMSGRTASLTAAQKEIEAGRDDTFRRDELTEGTRRFGVTESRQSAQDKENARAHRATERISAGNLALSKAAEERAAGKQADETSLWGGVIRPAMAKGAENFLGGVGDALLGQDKASVARIAAGSREKVAEGNNAARVKAAEVRAAQAEADRAVRVAIENASNESDRQNLLIRARAEFAERQASLGQSLAPEEIAAIFDGKVTESAGWFGGTRKGVSFPPVGGPPRVGDLEARKAAIARRKAELRKVVKR